MTPIYVKQEKNVSQTKAFFTCATNRINYFLFHLAFVARRCCSELKMRINRKKKQFARFRVWLRKVQKSSADNAQRQLCMIANVHFRIQQKRRNEKSVTIMNMKMIKMMCAEINQDADWHHTCASPVPIEHFTNRFRIHSLRQSPYAVATEQSRAYAKR